MVWDNQKVAPGAIIDSVAGELLVLPPSGPCRCGMAPANIGTIERLAGKMSRPYSFEIRNHSPAELARTINVGLPRQLLRQVRMSYMENATVRAFVCDDQFSVLTRS